MCPATSHTKKDTQTLVELAQVISDVGIVGFHFMGRWRVYPQDITAAPLVTAAGVANTFGNWAEIIPLNTISFPFHVIGICVCQVSAATNYFIQLGYNTVNADPGTNMEMGERRFRIATHPIARQTELMEIFSQGVPANSRVMARLKTASGVADTANMNVVISRHLDLEEMPPLWPAFPW